jgi:hypothetical protein
LLLILDEVLLGSAVLPVVVTSLVGVADVEDAGVLDGTRNASDVVMALASATTTNRYVKEETMVLLR